MPQPVYLTEDIRRMEQAAGDAAPPLMERAGAAAAAAGAPALTSAVARKTERIERVARGCSTGPKLGHHDARVSRVAGDRVRRGAQEWRRRLVPRAELGEQRDFGRGRAVVCVSLAAALLGHPDDQARDGHARCLTTVASEASVDVANASVGAGCHGQSRISR